MREKRVSAQRWDSPHREGRTGRDAEAVGTRTVEQADQGLHLERGKAESTEAQLSIIDKAFMEGTAAHKRSLETATPTATGKLSESQLARLMGWCGLGPGEQDRLPPIWAKLQGTKDKEDARAVLTKHFERLSGGLDEPLYGCFSDRLVEDIAKLRFSPGKEPDYQSAHLVISILAAMPVSARSRVAWDEELKDNARATVRTVPDVQAARKGPPAPPRAPPPHV